MTSEGDDDMATQANEPATRRKQMIAEGDDNMATQAYDDGDEENRSKNFDQVDNFHLVEQCLTSKRGNSQKGNH